MKKITTEQLEIEIIKRDLADIKKAVETLASGVDNMATWSSNISLLVMSLCLIEVITTCFLML